MYTRMNIQQVFSEDCIQHNSLSGDPFPAPDHGRPSSSSSSLRSWSVGSPEYSSLLLTKAGAPFMPEVTGEQALVVPPHQMSIARAYGRHRNYVQLQTPASDDAAITRAMLAAISSPSTSSSPPPLFYQSPCQDQVPQSRRSRTVGSFEPYNPALAPKVRSNPAVNGQKMVKTAISILRGIYQIRHEADQVQEARPTSNQLLHMISERKRREKLNESFHALRMLLPPGTKVCMHFEL